MFIFTTPIFLQSSLVFWYAPFYFVCAVCLSLILINAFLYIRCPISINRGPFRPNLYLRFESMLNRLIDTATTNTITASIAISLCIFSTAFSKICIMFSNFFGLNFLTPHPYLSLFTLDLSLFSNAEFFSQVQSRASFWDLLLKKGPRIFRLYSDQRKDKVLFLSLCVNPIVKRLIRLFPSNVPSNQCLEALTPSIERLLDFFSQDAAGRDKIAHIFSHIAGSGSVKKCSEDVLKDAIIAFTQYADVALPSIDNPKTKEALSELLTPFLSPFITTSSQLQNLLPFITPLIASLSQDATSCQHIARLISQVASRDSVKACSEDVLKNATTSLIEHLNLVLPSVALDKNPKTKEALSDFLTPFLSPFITTSSQLQNLLPFITPLIASLSQDATSCQHIARLISQVASRDSVKACSEDVLKNATTSLIEHLNLVLPSVALDKNPKTKEALSDFLTPFLSPFITTSSQLQNLLPFVTPLIASLSQDQRSGQSIAGLAYYCIRKDPTSSSRKQPEEPLPIGLLEDATQALVRVFTRTISRIDFQLEINRAAKNELCSLLANSLFTSNGSNTSELTYSSHDQAKQDRDVSYVISQIQRLSSAKTFLNFSGQYAMSFFRSLPRGLHEIYSAHDSRIQQLKLLMSNPALGSPDQIQSALSSSSFWLKILDDPSLIEKTILWPAKLFLRASNCLSLDDLYPARSLFPNSPLQDLTTRQLHDLIDLVIRSIKKVKNGKQTLSEAAAAYFSHNPDRFFASKSNLICLSVLLMNTLNDPELKKALASDEYSGILQKILSFQVLQSFHHPREHNCHQKAVHTKNSCSSI